MNRRGFLQAILAAGVAPAVVKAANIMPVFVRKEAGGLLVPEYEQFVITSISPGNMLLTPTMITKQALKILEGQMNGIAKVGGAFGGEFQVGDVITFGR